MHFKMYEEGDYQLVFDFFVELNSLYHTHINWNWARFEWMFFHPEFNNEYLPKVKLWIDDNRVFGLSMYDMYLGEGFAGVLHPSMYQFAFKKIVDYAYQNLKDDSGFSLALNIEEDKDIEVVKSLGFKEIDQYETMMELMLDEKRDSTLPKGFKFKEMSVIDDYDTVGWVIYQGFDHGDDKDEYDKNKGEEKIIRPHLNEKLSLGVINESGECVAYCCVWYLENTGYAYLEPVCVIPSYRRRGLAKAMIYEAFNRAMDLGARRGYVLSDCDFYLKLGFKIKYRYRFYHKD